MATSPPDIATDEERLAYYRGYLAGTGRQEYEGARFAIYQDLVFRIAAEQDRRAGRRSARLSYEDMVSLGYEAVLEVLRKKRDVERSAVAACIRRRLIDEGRVRFGRISICRHVKSGEVYASDSRKKAVIYGQTGHHERLDGRTGALEALAAQDDYTVEGDDLWGEMLVRLEKKLVGPGREKLDERLEAVLHGRIQGKKLKEIGEELGVSESRVCQILAEARPWLEEHILPLAESAA